MALTTDGGGALASHGRARVAVSAPDLTGAWQNVAAPNAAPPWQLTASNGLNALDGTWAGGSGHPDLHGSFNSTLTGEHSYTGGFKVDEDTTHVNGGITVFAVSPNRIEITLSPSAGGSETITFTRVAGGTSGPSQTATPTVEQVSAPSSFDETVTAPEPAPGDSAIVTSPALALGGAVQAPVNVEIGGLSVKDQVIANARHDCFVQFVKRLRGAAAVRLIARMNVGLEKLETLEATALANLASCLAFVDDYEQQLSSSSANLARASCAEVPVVLSLTGSGRHHRVRSIHFGDKHPPLRVNCSRTASGIRLSVSTQSRHLPLSAVVGSRLNIGIVRSIHDTAGGQLSVAFHRG